MIKTFSFKLYNSKKNKKLHQQINLAGIIYNHCISLHKRYYRLFGKHLNCYRLITHLTKLKHTKRYVFFSKLGSQAIQEIAERIDKAYQLFYRNLKHHIRTAPPSFKKVKRYKSFTLKQAGYKLLEGNKLRIGKQEYHYFKSRNIEGKIKTVTIKRDALGDIYVYFVCEVNFEPIKTRAGKKVGFDFGLKTFLTASDGNDITSPLFFKINARAIKQAQRRLSKKRKGSTHRTEARYQVARLHKHVYNQRKDFHFKLARKLCQEYSIICLETLNIKAMQRLYGRKISDLGFANFVSILKYEASLSRTEIIEIDKFYPSSQLCSVCGYRNPETKDLSVREWTCPECHMHHDRDRNAAINILKVGTSTEYERWCKTDVSQQPSPVS